MKITPLCTAALAASALLFVPVSVAQTPDGLALEEASASELVWNRRNVEHLLNRAAFGARPAEIDAALALGAERFVDHLLIGGRDVEPPFFSVVGVSDFGGLDGLSEKKKRDVRRKVRRNDREQLANYIGWWIERMVEGEDPLRDRMTLFWHGFFTTSSKNVRRTFEVIQQHQLLRENAIESYAVLLEGIVKDPAMLYYLDNTKNKKGKPNENLARELMELFSLGEGNYTEQDVQEVARALTGYQAGRDGKFRFNAKQHDRGEKTILGQTSKFRAEGVVRLILAQDACGEWISGRLIEYFEGVWPDEARHQEYASFLRENDYALQPFLRKLLLDPRFYRDEVVGTRVMGPVDFLVSSERRLGLEVPSRFIYSAGKELGQTLFQPPNVKGWEGGETWITTASLFGRGNAAGMMLGVLDTDQAMPGAIARGPQRGGDDDMMSDSDSEQRDAQTEVDPEPAMDMEMDMQDEMSMEGGRSESGAKRRLPAGIRTLQSSLGREYTPKLNLTWRLSRKGITNDKQVIDALLDELLAIEPPVETRDHLVRVLAAERKVLGLRQKQLLKNPTQTEPVLRHMAHLILSLPEAQLH